jgi:hypothetical protein
LLQCRRAIWSEQRWRCCINAAIAESGFNHSDHGFLSFCLVRASGISPRGENLAPARVNASHLHGYRARCRCALRTD